MLQYLKSVLIQCYVPVYHDLNVLVRLQAVDVLLGELCPSLDEDMADLDEYEMGAYDNPQRKYEYQ